MLTFREIQFETADAVYRRGRMLYQDGKVGPLSIIEENQEGYPTTRIHAQVQGRRLYDVEVLVDDEMGEIIEFYCDCPAYDSYEGLCKHCVAVLIKYLYEQGETEAANPAAYAPRQMLQPVRQTSREMQELLSIYGIQDKIPYLQSDIMGNIRIEPKIQISPGRMSVEFKLGYTQLYVMKDIGNFARSVRRNEKVRYGKKLEFYHHRSAFTEESQPLLDFILNEKQTANQDRSYYGYGYFANQERELFLNESSRDAFFEAMKDREIQGTYLGCQECSCRLQDGRPKQQLTVKGEDGGVSLCLENVLMCCHGSIYDYYVDQEHIWRTPRKENAGIELFQNLIQERAGTGIFVGKAELSMFCREMLPRLREHYQVNLKQFEPEDYLPEPVQFKSYLDMPQEDMVTCKFLACYGEKNCNVFEGGKLTENRDMTAEFQAGEIVRSYFNAYDSKSGLMVLTEDEEGLYRLLLEGIPAFHEFGEVYVSDALKKLKVVPSPKVQTGISLNAGLLEFTVKTEDMSLEQLAQVLSAYEKKKNFVRLKNGSFIQVEEEGIGSLSHVTQMLGIQEGQLKEGSVSVEKYRALYLNESLKEIEGVSFERNRDFKALIRNMKTALENDYELPEGLKGTLREYQQNGYLWLQTLSHNGFGGLLADDMGLGKTLQVIAWMLAAKEEAGEEQRQMLVVCPASLVYNWKSEIDKFAPNLKSATMVGNQEERRGQILSGAFDVMITSYDLLRRDLQWYKEKRFFGMVIDEAQYIKNHSTQQAKAVKQIQAGFRMALTGTPIENNLSEVWSIYDFLMPGFLYTYKRFRDEIEKKVINGDEDALKRLQKMIGPFLLRRLKKDVLKDLPDKMEEVYRAQPAGEQKKLYQAHVQRLRMMLEGQTEEEFKANKIYVLSELTKLRQLCCSPALLYENYKGESPKQELCVELVKRAVDGGHKILLFSQFTSMLNLLEEGLKQEGISYFMLTGATPKKRRIEMVEEFNKDTTSVFLISLKAGGTGLNLTAADMVIHYDPWWNLSAQNQATDRAHRIGQKQVVNVYKLIMSDTIEEKILKLQERKKDLADKVLGAEQLSVSQFTREELMEILQFT